MENILGMGLETALALALILVLDWQMRRPPWYELLWCGALVYLDAAGFLRGLDAWAAGSTGEPARDILLFCLVILFALTQVLSAAMLFRLVYRSFRNAPAGERKLSLPVLLWFLPQFYLGAWRAGPTLPAVIALALVALPAALGAAERNRSGRSSTPPAFPSL